MDAIRRILVAVKEPAAKTLPAVLKAAELAKAFGAELVLFQAIALLGRCRAFYGRPLREIS